MNPRGTGSHRRLMATLVAVFALTVMCGDVHAERGTDSNSKRRLWEIANRHVERIVERRHGTAAKVQSIRLGEAPIGKGEGDGVYVSFLYAPDALERTNERLIAAVVVMPTKIVARPLDLLPESQTEEISAVLETVLRERLAGRNDPRVAEAARLAVMGERSVGGIQPSALWTSHKDGRPTLHIAWSSCTFEPCDSYPIEVTIPATWLEGP